MLDRNGNRGRIPNKASEAITKAEKRDRIIERVAIADAEAMDRKGRRAIARLKEAIANQSSVTVSIMAHRFD